MRMKKVDRYINLIEEKYGYIAKLYFIDKIVEYATMWYQKINKEMEKEKGND